MFSILHLSDLHRDKTDEIDNSALLDSLIRDSEKWREIGISEPKICIVSGDLVMGVLPDHPNWEMELERQYRQTEEFLDGVADRFLGGDHGRIVIVPGNHDVSLPSVVSSLKRIKTPSNATRRKSLYKQLRSPNSRLRWSWESLEYYEIAHPDVYERRFEQFALSYGRFYRDARHYSLCPSDQVDSFDFPDLQLTVIGLNSCHENDPFNQAGKFHPSALAKASAIARDPKRAGWTICATWHHNFAAPPGNTNYVDQDVLQFFIDCGISVGFHGHQHLPECFDERFQIGTQTRKITVISASTLCASPSQLTPGIPRSFNLVEIDTPANKGSVHQRKQVNLDMSLPTWGPGHFPSSNDSRVDFAICPPLSIRPKSISQNIELELIETHIGAQEYEAATSLLASFGARGLARPMLLRVIDKCESPEVAISLILPLASDAEAAIVGARILELDLADFYHQYLSEPLVLESGDASVRELREKIARRVTK